MKNLILAFFCILAVHAMAQDKVTLHTGKAENCKVVRFKDGRFICEMADGRTNQVSSSVVREIVFDAGSDAEPIAAGQPLEGRFYCGLHVTLKVYVNGSLVFDTISNGTIVFSEETTLREGDIVLCDMKPFHQKQALKLAFLSKDLQTLVSFQGSDFRDLGLQPDVAAVTADRLASTKVRARPVRIETKEPPLLPNGIRDRSQFVWGKEANCMIGTVVTKQMISQIKR